MANPTNISKKQALGKQSKSDRPEQRDIKAIKADKKINKQDKPFQQKEKDEKEMLRNGTMKASSA